MTPAKKKGAPHVDRGEYRPIFRALYRGADFQRLSNGAKLVFHYLKGELPASGIDIWPLLCESLAEQIGTMSVDEVRNAIGELEREGWIRYEHRVVWIRRGLRFEPSFSPNNEKHRIFLEHHLSGLPNGAIVREFREAYADWLSGSATPDSAERVREGLASASRITAATRGEGPDTPSDTHPDTPSDPLPQPIPNAPRMASGETSGSPAESHAEGDSKGNRDQTITNTITNTISTVPLQQQRVPAAVASDTGLFSAGNAPEIAPDIARGAALASRPALPDPPPPSLAAARAHVIRIGGNETPLGELSPTALRKLRPMAYERGDTQLMAFVDRLLVEPELHAAGAA